MILDVESVFFPNRCCIFLIWKNSQICKIMGHALWCSLLYFISPGSLSKALSYPLAREHTVHIFNPLYPIIPFSNNNSVVFFNHSLYVGLIIFAILLSMTRVLFDCCDFEASNRYIVAITSTSWLLQ